MTIGATSRMVSCKAVGDPASRPVLTNHSHARGGENKMEIKNAKAWYAQVALGLLVSVASGCDRSLDDEAGLAKRESSIATSANEAVLGFEDPGAWAVTQGSIAPGTTNPMATEGSSSLAVNPAGFAVLTSQPISVRSALTGAVSYDLFVPSDQANRYWFGATQLYLNCPSLNLYNAFVGQAELTQLETNRFHTIRFAIPESTLAALDQGCADLSFSIALNVPWNERGTYLLDNLQLGTAGDSLSPVLNCVFSRAQDRYYAQFSYVNAAQASLSVPVGSENFFAPNGESVGQPEVFSSGSSSAPFTVPFDGAPLSWHLGRAVATASSESPACPSVWVPAWTGRGPLSTTIITNRTLTDATPNLTGRTLRVMAHLTTSGTQVRIRLSQRFSASSLDVEEAHVAIGDTGSSIFPATDRALTFGGNATVSVPAGEDVWSDPVALDVSAGQNLAVSLYVPGSFVPTTQGGRGQVKTSYHKVGNQVAATSLSGASRTRQVFGVYEVQVLSAGPAAAIVALGDSITEGACSSLDADGDWPDLLSQRLPLLADGTAVSVLNAGIGSGRFASSDGAGIRGLSRLDELLTLPAVRWVTLLMGVNDISYELVDAAFLEDAYAQAITKAHAAGKKLIGIPILPFGTSTKDVGGNVQVAQEVNAWIRAHDKRLGAPEPSYDAVVDLEPILIDPEGESWALPSTLTCDGVHPNQAGYRAIANAIPLDIFN
jgi:lysophospholipase L1-like esterase